MGYTFHNPAFFRVLIKLRCDFCILLQFLMVQQIRKATAHKFRRNNSRRQFQLFNVWKHAFFLANSAVILIITIIIR